MSERLSRVERYERSRNTKHTKTRHRRSSGVRQQSTASDLLLEDPEEANKASTSTSTWDESFYAEAATTAEASEAAYQEPSESEDKIDLQSLPTRKEMFPSQRLRLQKWFLNSLLYIFIALLVFLLWWGISESPWGQKYGL